MELRTSCEDPNTVYLCFSASDRRLVFYEGRYVGWYNAGTNKKQVVNT